MEKSCPIYYSIKSWELGVGSWETGGLGDWTLASIFSHLAPILSYYYRCNPRVPIKRRFYQGGTPDKKTTRQGTPTQLTCRGALNGYPRSMLLLPSSSTTSNKAVQGHL